MTSRLPSLRLVVLATHLLATVGCATETQSVKESERQASTQHPYIGATFQDALLGNELPAPLQGSGEAILEGAEPLGYVHARDKDKHVILLDRLLSQAPVKFEIVDVLEIGTLAKDEHVAYGTCTVSSGAQDPRVVAVGSAARACEESPTFSASRAWRVNVAEQRFEGIDVEGITCSRWDCETGATPLGVMGGVAE